MNQRVLLLVCTVLAALSTPATCDEPIDCSYVDWSVLTEKYIDTLKETKAVLDKIDGHNPNEIMRNLELLVKMRTNDFERQIYADLFALTKPNKQLEINELNRVLQISLLMHSTPGEWGRFAEFLKQFGRDKFGQISKTTSVGIVNAGTVQKNAGEELDKFILALMGWPERTEDPAEALRSFNLEHSPLNVREALKASEKSPRTSEVFFQHLDRLCHYFRDKRIHGLNIVALADAFGFEGQDNSLDRKWKEYHRLCLSLKRPESTEAIKDNVNLALKNSSSSKNNKFKSWARNSFRRATI